VTLRRFNYYKYVVGWDCAWPHWKLNYNELIWLSHIAASWKGMEKRKKIHGHCGFVQTFELWVVTPLYSHTTRTNANILPTKLIY